MPEVQNIGAQDYTQYQPEMYQQAQTPEEMNMQMPMAYEDPALEEKRSAAFGMKGLAIAGILGAVAGGLLTHKFAGGKGASSAKEAVEKELNELKNSEAVKNYEKVKDALINVEKETEGASKFCWYKPKTWGTSALVNKIKNLIKPAKEGFEKVEKEGEKVTEKVTEEGKKAVEENAKK